MKQLVFSELTKTIYLAEGKEDKKIGCFVASGKKEDFTDSAIKMVFLWFISQLKKGDIGHEIRYPGYPFVLKIMREDKECQ